MASFDYRWGDPVVTLENVSVTLGGKLIIRNVSQVVKDVIRPDKTQGQVVAILGPSGRGKTKLSEVMAGLLSGRPGEVEVTGQVLLNKEKMPVRRGEVGFVFQDYQLLEHRRVWGNLWVGAMQKERSLERRWWKRLPLSQRWRLDHKNAAAKAENLLERFGLGPSRNLYPAQLSGGQRQRVAIAQQLLCSDHFVILDEPFSGLDPSMKENVVEQLQQVALMDELSTLFVITHDVGAAVSVADTIWMLGYEKDETTQAFKPGATIVKTWNLIDLDLAWHPGILHTPKCREFVDEVEQLFGKI